MDGRVHELEFARLLAPDARARWRALLETGSERARAKTVALLYHTLRVDPRYAVRVPDLHATEEQGWTLAELRRRGAPGVAYLMSPDAELDRTFLPLETTLERVESAVLSCIPGRLAYYSGEDPGERYLLDRPRG